MLWPLSARASGFASRGEGSVIDTKASGSSLPTTGFLWIALFAAGAFVAHEVPWQGSRPAASEPKPYAYVAQQDIDARLWQDPMAAVRKGIEEAKKQPKPAPSTIAPGTVAAADPRPAHDMTVLGETVRSAACTADAAAGAPTLVLGVMISGSPYAEAVEFRRRARYAALAGLSRLGFVPEDAEHLGYVNPVPKKPGDLPEFVPYEWLKPFGKLKSHVLMLWLDEGVFGTDTVDRLRQVRDGLAVKPCADGSLPVVKHLVIGPAFTSTLEGMLAAKPSAAGWAPFKFYAYGATGDDAKLLPPTAAGAAPSTVHEALAARKIDLVRTIGADGTLAGSLLHELSLRGLDLSANCTRREKDLQHVALITEWDTAYGRIWPDAIFQRILQGDPCTASLDPASSSRAVDSALHRFSYLRGLDGETPGTTQPAASSSGKGSGSRDGGGAAGDRNRSKLIERPEGQSQFDYLRRLSIGIDALNRRLMQRDGGGIRAIGVLGSDVYDKLLILQALHGQFPEVVFFTTDLDARLMHPQEQEWARNLVVASNYALQLKDDLQGNVPPFRDAYQTSLYLSVLAALNDAAHRCDPGQGTDDDRCITQARLARWLDTPRVFELGRNIAFNFTHADEGPCIADDLAQCGDIHPKASHYYPTPATSALRHGFLLIVGGLVLLGLTQGMGHWIWVAFAERRLRSLAALAFGVVILAVVTVNLGRLWNGFARHLTQGGDGEPILFFEGISVWPTEAIRFVALAFSVGFVVWAWRLLDGNLARISTALRFEPDYAELVKDAKKEYTHGKWRWLRRVLRAFSFRLEEASHGRINRGVGLARDAQYFWKKYIFQGTIFARLCRVVAAVVVYWLVSATVIQFFGFPVTPYRGEVSLHWNQALLILSVTAMLFVIFFVVDATVFSYQLISALQIEIVPLVTQPKSSVAASTAAPVAIAAPAPPAPPAIDEERLTLPAPAPVAAPVPHGSRWTTSTLAHYKERFGLDPIHLDSWILMDFITLRTRVVAKLVYFPFIVISLMVVSRSQFFDNWNMPVGLLLVFVASVVIVSVCAVLLRMSAERARAGAIKHLCDQLIRLKGGNETERRAVPQIELMIAQIRALHEGAFAPYSQQPLFRALLLPLSTFGGTALLDWFTAASL